RGCGLSGPIRSAGQGARGMAPVPAYRYPGGVAGYGRSARAIGAPEMTAAWSDSMVGRGRAVGRGTLRSSLDSTSGEYAAAAEAMTAKLAEVEAEYAKNIAGGGPNKMARHRKRGKMTARERIELLIDEDSPFLELAPLAAWGSEFHVGASVVAGI